MTAQGMPREARRREGGSGPSGLASPVGEADAPALGANGVSQSAVERVRQLLVNVASLLDAWKAGDPTHWTEWDQEQRDEITALLATQSASDTGLRERLLHLSIAAGQLVVAADDQLPLRECRQRVLDELKLARTALASTSDEGVDTALNGEGDGG